MTDDVIFEKRGAIGLVTLNRPQAMNALNRAMCVALHRQLDDWAVDDAVKAVAVQGAGERAFCAGGDVVGLYHAGKAGSPEWEGFFADEYRMNHAISTFPKPYVALVDGITMGGGVGISIHAPYRVATERTLFAMPETAIGLIPDVGGTHALPRLPGELGTYLGLTGARLRAADCLYAEIATHHVPAERIEALIAALAEGATVEETLGAFHQPAGDAPIAAYRDAIDFHFAHDQVEDIMESLKGGDEWATATHATLATMSPTSMKLTLRGLRAGTGLSLAGCLENEYRIVCAIKQGHDFYEGVRAMLIDKDKKPAWNPDTLEAVDDAMIDGYFRTPKGGDLVIM